MNYGQFWIYIKITPWNFATFNSIKYSYSCIATYIHTHSYPYTHTEHVHLECECLCVFFAMNNEIKKCSIFSGVQKLPWVICQLVICCTIPGGKSMYIVYANVGMRLCGKGPNVWKDLWSAAFVSYKSKGNKNGILQIVCYCVRVSAKERPSESWGKNRLLTFCCWGAKVS